MPAKAKLAVNQQTIDTYDRVNPAIVMLDPQKSDILSRLDSIVEQLKDIARLLATQIQLLQSLKNPKKTLHK